MSRVNIIGGGVIGLCSAYYLHQDGHEVSVFDSGQMNEGCSFGNAGMIVPSHIVPLAAPGTIAKGIRWMFNSSSPFYVRPRLSGDIIRWGWQFYKHATREHVERSIPALKQLSMFSKALYQTASRELPFDFGYKENGLLMLYQTKATEEEEIEASHVAREAGLEAHVLSLAEIQNLETEVRVAARGGVYYPGDAQIIPQQLMTGMKKFLGKNGVKFFPETHVKDFAIRNEKVVALQTNAGTYDTDELVLATGSWSGELAVKLGLNLLMQAGKGYSFTLRDVPKNTKVPTIFLEDRVAVTPMENSLRFGGTMEIAGVNDHIDMKRMKGIVDAIPRYYPDMNISMPAVKDVWYGLRPCSPDGLPYLGRVNHLKNVVVATGHSMLGISLGPGTGKLVSEIVARGNTSIALDLFSPERYA